MGGPSGLLTTVRCATLDEENTSVEVVATADESLIKLAMYFRNWHMFREYMNNIAC